jgi:hypothetical protein
MVRNMRAIITKTKSKDSANMSGVIRKNTKDSGKTTSCTVKAFQNGRTIDFTTASNQIKLIYYNRYKNGKKDGFGIYVW